MYENFDNCLSPFEFSNTASLRMQDFAPVSGLAVTVRRMCRKGDW